MRMLDLFCGRWGWSKAFAARGWKCVGIDLVDSLIPENCEYVYADIMDCTWERGALKVWARGSPVYGQMWIRDIDFICASSPCEQFSVHCMKFTKKKDHPYPERGIKLFNHTRQICEESGLPYVMENVRCAEQFVGRAQHHSSAFYLWGNAVPPILPKGILKMGNQCGYYKKGVPGGFVKAPPGRWQPAAKSATIPPELANCVADYAERLCEQKRMAAMNEVGCQTDGTTSSNGTTQEFD